MQYQIAIAGILIVMVAMSLFQYFHERKKEPPPEKLDTDMKEFMEKQEAKNQEKEQGK